LPHPEAARMTTINNAERLTRQFSIICFSPTTTLPFERIGQLSATDLF
jgi:hypothetical protein